MNILTFETSEVEADIIEISDYRAKHLKEVIKVVPGQEIRVGQVGGKLDKATVESIDDDSIRLKLLRVESTANVLELELLIAMPRPQTLKKVLELVGCFSIRKLTLVKTTKVEESYFKSSVLNAEQIKKHLLLGMQQGVKTMLPEIIIDKDFFSAVSSAEHETKIVMHNHNSIMMNQLALDKNSKSLFAFGPEGGWTEQELEHFTKHGFKTVSLSNAVLRVENAVCSALSQYEMLINGSC